MMTLFTRSSFNLRRIITLLIIN